MTAALLLVLGLLDGCFSGFRAAAGRDGRTDKRAYARRACVEGTAAGVLVMSVVGAALATALLAGIPFDRLEQAGGAMLAVYVPYALVVLLALVGWVTLRPLELQTLMSTLVLGPFTLVRPLVVLVGCTCAWWESGDRVVGALALLSGALVLAVEPVLRRLRPPDVPVTPPPWASAQPRTMSR